MNRLAAYDSDIDAVLEAFFTRNEKAAFEIHPRYGRLWQELARTTRCGGKRLRPKMTLLAYEAFRGPDDPDGTHIMPVAAAQEVLHASLLMHDDIMDRESYRRGQLNVSGAFEQNHYAAVPDTTDRRHHSDSAALLGGDLLLAATFMLVQECALPEQRRMAAQHMLHKSVFEVAGGQLLDSEMGFLPGDDVSAELIAHYKTASYSFIGPLLTGAVLAGVDDDRLQTIETFGRHLGIAFQYIDDILGVFGDEQLTGKSIDGDLREGKHTLLVERFVATASAPDIDAFRRSFGNPDLDDAEAMRLRRLLTAYGVRATVERDVERHADLARQALGAFGIDDSYRSDFEALIAACTRRHV